jgi:hypothetical protein
MARTMLIVLSDKKAAAATVPQRPFERNPYWKLI